MTQKLISIGAEAKIYLKGNKIIKKREQKKYRHPILDEKIRKQRTRHEAKILYKSKKLGINVPLIFNLNKKYEPQKKYDIEIEYIKGEKLSENLDNYNKEKQFNIMKKIGKEIAKIHENDIIHSDLTTSNMILKDNEIYLIDFGLSYISKKIENKAVDLHLLKQALEARHYKNHKMLFLNFLKEYKHKEKQKIIERLKAVEKRGRYKH